MEVQTPPIRQGLRGLCRVVDPGDTTANSGIPGNYWGTTVLATKSHLASPSEPQVVNQVVAGSFSRETFLAKPAAPRGRKVLQGRGQSSSWKVSQGQGQGWTGRQRIGRGVIFRRDDTNEDTMQIIGRAELDTNTRTTTSCHPVNPLRCCRATSTSGPLRPSLTQRSSHYKRTGLNRNLGWVCNRSNMDTQICSIGMERCFR